MVGPCGRRASQPPTTPHENGIRAEFGLNLAMWCEEACGRFGGKESRSPKRGTKGRSLLSLAAAGGARGCSAPGLVEVGGLQVAEVAFASTL